MVSARLSCSAMVQRAQPGKGEVEGRQRPRQRASGKRQELELQRAAVHSLTKRVKLAKGYGTRASARIVPLTYCEVVSWQRSKAAGQV